jgi:SAM-dependent methyltransferase
MNEPEYVLGTHDAELHRLGFQHRVWAQQAYALWERAGFSPGQRILDVGCGPGFATLDIASLVGPGGRVTAVDESRRFIDHLGATCAAQGVDHVDAMVSDVHEMRLDDGHYDGAFARWVLCFVRDPEAVVATVARSLKPGGVFAVQDYFHYRAMALAPKNEAMVCVARAVEQCWKAGGGRVDVMGQVPGMMRRADLIVASITPVSRVARPGAALWEWPASFFRGFLPTMVRMGVLSEEDKAAFERDWAECSCDPDAFFLTPAICDVVGVKQGE